MIDLLKTEKEFIRTHIKEGGTVVDFTMGNGHDTLWLSNAVGENGKVYAFDIQQAALDSTSALLKKENAPYTRFSSQCKKLCKRAYLRGIIQSRISSGRR